MASAPVQSANNAVKTPTFTGAPQQPNFLQQRIMDAGKQLSTPVQPTQDTFKQTAQIAAQQAPVATNPKTLERVSAAAVFAGRGSSPTPTPSNNPFMPVNTKFQGLQTADAIAHSGGSKDGGGNSSSNGGNKRR